VFQIRNVRGIMASKTQEFAARVTQTRRERGNNPFAFLEAIKDFEGLDDAVLRLAPDSEPLREVLRALQLGTICVIRSDGWAQIAEGLGRKPTADLVQLARDFDSGSVFTPLFAALQAKYPDYANERFPKKLFD